MCVFFFLVVLEDERVDRRVVLWPLLEERGDLHREIAVRRSLMARVGSFRRRARCGGASHDQRRARCGGASHDQRGHAVVVRAAAAGNYKCAPQQNRYSWYYRVEYTPGH